MDNGGDILQLCRLCLVKDDVNIPIFEEQGDIRQILQKISSCLPVKVSGEDKLPKKICDGCSYKLDMFYEFWNTTANSEKQLLKWLGEAEMNSKATDGTAPTVAQPLKPAETVVKQEAIDPSDIHTEENDDDKTYMFQQKFSTEEAASAPAASNEEPPPPKRARRTAAVKAQIAMDPESDDDEDSGEAITKIEDESEDSEGDDHEPSFVDVPSTSADDQPGPSGVGKDGGDAPYYYEIFGEPEIQFRCTVCNRIYTSLRKLRRHSMYHKEKTFLCEICGNKSVTQGKLVDHQRTVHYRNREIRYNCEICSKTFSSRRNMRNHVKYVHANNKPYICGKCGKGYLLQKLLVRHEQIYHQGRRRVCEFCNKQFKTDEGYKGHVITHDSNFKTYSCPICSQEYYHKSSFRAHQRFHEGAVKEKICEICGITVTSNTSLKYHIRRHLGEKPLKCEMCEKRFTTTQLLKIHSRTHTKEKPFKCTVCNKRFTQKPTLNVHMRYHTGERPFSCLACSKKFVTKTLLKYHKCKIQTEKICLNIST